MEKIQINDFLGYKRITGFQVSPDKKNACFSVQTIVGNDYKFHLWILNTKSKQYSKLTSDGKEKTFIWLDNETVMFPCLRNKELKEKAKEGEFWTEYYTKNINTGEESEYLQIPLKVSNITPVDEDNYILTALYNKDSISLYGLCGEDRAQALAKIKEEEDYVVLDEIPFCSNGSGYVNKNRNRLYLYNKETQSLTPITDELTTVKNFRVKDSTILYTSNRYETMMENGVSLNSYNISTKENAILTKQGEYAIGYFNFMGDKIILLMSDMKAGGLGQYEDIYLFKDGKFTLVAKHDTGFGSNVGSDCKLGKGASTCIIDDVFYFTSTINCGSFIRKLTLDGKITLLTENKGTIDSFQICDDEILFLGLRGNNLQEIYSLKDNLETQITAFNQDVQEKSISTPEYLSFVNKDGVKIEGFVLKPVDFDENKTYPGILTIHGGPRSVFGNVFFHEMQVWANSGYFVFYGNPRGSDGRDSDFQELRGKFGTIDFEDLMELTDTVIATYPQLDKNRLGVTGGSYGGFMTSWIAGHTDRFKCAAFQRCVSNWITKFGTCDVGYNVSATKSGGTPWDGVEKMWWHSPLKYADKITCPVLLIYSELDYRACLVEGIQMFTALKFLGVESKMRIFKGENHGLSVGGKPNHRIKRMEEVNGWFDKYLK